MAFTIFRINYYKGNIPVMNIFMYHKIKEAYYGGNMIMSKHYGTNLYYYDINSLYPYSMLNDMPGVYLRYLADLNVDTFVKNDLFGFYYCTVYIPSNMSNFHIINRVEGHLAYPTGLIKGLYFSEEIKNWIKLGYNIKVYNGYEFARLSNIFNDYVLNFYSLKSTAINPGERYILKLLLNGLYGYFGRYPINDITKIVDYNEFQIIGYYHDIYFFNEINILLNIVLTLNNH